MYQCLHFTEYVGNQLEDLTQTFRSKAQEFAEKLVGEVFASREGSEVTDPAGEPPAAPPAVPGSSDPQVYRDESRTSEMGKK